MVEILGGIAVKKNVKLKNFTTYNIGGKAKLFYICNDTAELIELLNFYDGPVTILGKGSNVLVSDKGIKGLTVVMRNDNIIFDSDVIIADAGVSLPMLSKAYLNSSFSGMEWACSIPGSVGGAVIMNCGAFGVSVSDIISFAEVLRQGKVIRLTNEECGFSYRKSEFMAGDVILRAAFRYTKAEREVIAETMQKYLIFRKETQPGGCSAGSVFKAADRPAGWYIDNAGLKGLTSGGAVVSEKHANFIINSGGATAGDVAALIKMVKAEVFARYNVELVEEIKYLGEF